MSAQRAPAPEDEYDEVVGKYRDAAIAWALHGKTTPEFGDALHAARARLNAYFARVASPVPDADALTVMADEIATRLVCKCPEMETMPWHDDNCPAPRAASEVREYLRVQLSRAPQGGPR